MRRSPTNSTETSAPPTPSASSDGADQAADGFLVHRHPGAVVYVDEVHAVSFPPAAPLTPAGVTAAPASSEGSRALRPRRLRALVVLAVGVDDALHELVPHHVVTVELHHADVWHVVQDLPHRHEPARAAVRQVDLRHVAGDDHLRAEAQPREEHLHLLGRGVLRLVQDDERVVEGAAAHEGQRRHLDLALLDERRQLLAVHHVVERVEQRPEVGVDLLGHGARQEAEALPRLHRRPREDDAADLLARRRRSRPWPWRGRSCRCRRGRCRR